ncbi:MAG: metallophosphoesterase [Deltaproteobacteria bacterium]|nr:metallophosphoesterase [Deltaproteobacteria bacterium]
MHKYLSLIAIALVSQGCGSGGSSEPTPIEPGGDGSVDDVSIHGDASDHPDVSESDGKPDTAKPDGAPGEDGPLPPQEAGPDAPNESSPPVTYMTVVMAGDVAEDGRTQYAKINAEHITSHDPPVQAVVLLGDNARYDLLSIKTLLSYYNTYYKAPNEANWGQFDPISFPQLGNHEYGSLNPQGYFDYFKPRMNAIKALPDYSGFIDVKGKAYYSFDLNGWHFVSLNANCSSVDGGGCGPGSEQEKWLKADLAAHPNQPIIGAWHNPRWACGGSHESDSDMQAFWADLYDARADFVFVGHDHYYQRWKPLDKGVPEAQVDAVNGLIEVVAGSCGVSTYGVCDPVDPRIDSQAGDAGGMGVFFLKLGSDGSYSFEYVLESDGSVFDSGSGVSHHAP